MDSDVKLVFWFFIIFLVALCCMVYHDSNNKHESNKLIAESCKTMNLAIKINDWGYAECFKP